MIFGVYGSTSINSQEIADKAREIGRQIAKNKDTLVTGGCPGFPYEAVIGATEFNGKCIAYSPAINSKEHIEKYNLPVKGFTKIDYISKDFIHSKNDKICYKYRNILSVASVDVAIIISGRIGSMNEFTIAYDLGKLIGVLENSGGITNEAIQILLRDASKNSGAKAIFEKDPVLLIKKLREEFMK